MSDFGMDRDYVIHDTEKIHGFFGPYRFLSNFHPCIIQWEGIEFQSVEHAYVASKLNPNAVEFDKFWYTNKIRAMVEPGEAKNFGKEIKASGLLRPDWDRVKIDIMSALCFDKFYRNKNLREQLLATGDRYLQETNHWKDSFWGVCNGSGQNNLGKIHMNIRSHWKTFYPELFDKKKVTELF